ncbi:MAG: hypothetical protein OXC07_00540, partial [Kistimonas sp.]|nr:hypothetical protein [Kistimonas sp.]
ELTSESSLASGSSSSPQSRSTLSSAPASGRLQGAESMDESAPVEDVDPAARPLRVRHKISRRRRARGNRYRNSRPRRGFNEPPSSARRRTLSSRPASGLERPPAPDS